MRGITAALLLGTALTPSILANPTGRILSPRDIRGSINPAASNVENDFQPLTDFDKDGCYYTSAIDPNGNVNPGISKVVAKKPQDGCRTRDRLDNNNVYSRKRCNNGYCAIMYEYYFEKDQAAWGSFAGGHKDDWENIIVFTKGDEVVRVAASCHGGYKATRDKGNLMQEGKRAKLVYHKDGAGTHCWRFAEPKDDKVENVYGGWVIGKLVGWDNWPNGELRKKMLDSWPNGVGPKLTDWKDKFVNSLRAAAADKVPGFDPAKDE